MTLNECIQNCIDARVSMTAIIDSVPDDHIIGKAAQASVRCIDMTWELIEKDKERAELIAKAESCAEAAKADS